MPCSQRTQVLSCNMRFRSATAAHMRTTIPWAAQTKHVDVQTVRQISDLPVEEGLPLLGKAPELLSSQFNIDHLFEKHGGPFVINASILGGRAVCLRDEDLILEAQLKRADVLSMMLQESFVRIVTNGRRKDLISLEDSRKWRAALHKALSFTAVMNVHVPLMIPLVFERVNAVAAAERQVRWYDEARWITFCVSTRAAVGEFVPRKDLEKLFPLFHEVTDGVFSLNFGLRDGVPGTPYNKAVQARQSIEDMLIPLIREGLAHDEKLGSNSTALGRLAHELREEGAAIMDCDLDRKAEYFCGEAFGLMFAGTDTTAHSLLRAVISMAKHPEWLEKMWEEQQRLMESYGDELTAEVVQKSAVAAAVAQEVLRLGNNNLLQQRQASADTVVGDLEVPEGTNVWLVPSKAIMEAGDAKAEFDPTQWLGSAAKQSSTPEGSTECPAPPAASNGSTQSAPSPQAGGFPFNFKQQEAQATKKYIFGVGPRSCVGQNLAVTELVVFLAVLAREVKEARVSMEDQERVFAPFFLHPTGVPVEFIPRDK